MSWVPNTPGDADNTLNNAVSHQTNLTYLIKIVAQSSVDIGTAAVVAFIGLCNSEIVFTTISGIWFGLYIINL